MKPFYAPRHLDRPTEVPLDPQADLSALDEAKIFAAPSDPALWPAWRDQLRRWREGARERLTYSGERYDHLSVDGFVVGMVSLWDESLYDHKRGEFTVDAFLGGAEREFGGFDSVLLWHAYPVVGIDARRQFDFYREIPELPDVVVRSFQERGVRVFVSYYPWATGVDSHSVEETAQLVSWLGAEGIFLDTVKEGSEALRAALDSISPGILIGGESRVPLARIHDQQMSWAQWFADSPVPGVMRAKWFERRHIMQHTRRWHRSHLDELHSAWLNGCGVLVWENVFGVWVGWSEKDKATLRAMRRVYRHFAKWLSSEAWTPLADHPGNAAPIYASRWEHKGSSLWTLVNKGDAYDGPWLVTDDRPGRRWREVTTGAELTPVPVGGDRVSIGGHIAAGGVAAVIATSEPVVAEQLPSADGNSAFPGRVAVRVQTPVVVRETPPNGMIACKGGRHELTVRYRLRETGLYGEPPFVDEWKPPLSLRLHHTATMTRAVDLGPFAIGVEEITNAEYAAFLAATGYAPKRRNRFLNHWRDGLPPSESLEEAATNVDLDDARAYAAWAGFRLPTEDEWQLAASAGVLLRLQPLVWNLTESEHADGRTRFVILKGGSSFCNHSSEWYFDGGEQQPDLSAKLLTLAGGLSRSPSIGFRCAVDLTDAQTDYAS